MHSLSPFGEMHFFYFDTPPESVLTPFKTGLPTPTCPAFVLGHDFGMGPQPTMKEQVLQAMREAGKPVSAGDVTKALGADRKEVDKAFAELKKEGAIVSPVRCKWEPAK